MPVAGHTLLVTTADSPGVLSQITQVIATHPANIRSIESLGPRDDGFVVYLELDPIDDYQALRARLLALAVVQADRRTAAADGHLRQARHHHGRRRAGRAGGRRRDQRSRPAQHPGRAHLGRHDPAGRRRDARRRRACRGAAAARPRAGAGRGVDGRRHHRGRRATCSGPASSSSASTWPAACPMPPIWWSPTRCRLASWR